MKLDGPGVWRRRRPRLCSLIVVRAFLIKVSFHMFSPFTTTGIGSMPHVDPVRACAFILEHVDIPFWPQLPGLSFRELMIPQYSEGLPNVRLSADGQRIWIETGGEHALDAFYEAYSEDAEYGISEEYARGFYAFTEMIEGRRFGFLKGHVTGPLTFTLGLKDEKGVPVFFNEELREISLMVLRGKVRWQTARLGRFCEKVMVFIDEPILSAVGTPAYMGVPPQEVSRLLSAVVAEIERCGGIPAIHCCGKADWQVVLESGIRVVNFDAFDYFDNLRIYADSLSGFLDRGGFIAAGIVPTGEALEGTTAEQLSVMLRRQLDELSAFTGFGDVSSRVLLTPSCGTGSMKEQDAERVFELLSSLKGRLLS